VTFSLPRATWAEVKVYDLSGHQVTSLVSGSFSPGRHTVIWTGRDARGGSVLSGTSIVRLESDERVETRKVILIRLDHGSRDSS